MKNFRLWLEELAEEENELLAQHGYKFKDQIKTGDLTMVLLEAPHFPAKLRYHLAFHRAGRSSFNINHQFSRDEDKLDRKARGESGVGIIAGYKALRPLMDKLVEWLHQYPKLVIASTNEELTAKWLANLTVASRYFDIPLSVKTETIMGHTIHFIKLS
jgi:hypothetical protein